jgi:cobyrinic acid a,c-diamide synthase
MAALRRRGLTVAPFKVGPDFIDPGHHSLIAGRDSRNLDGWMLTRAYNVDTFHRHAAGCDVAVVEGVMGLFDGYSGDDEAGSTAQMAKWLNLPVLLVVDAASMARSAAALVQGFERFDPQVRFAGVVFNNLGSEGHLAYLKTAMAEYVRMPLLGGLLRDQRLRMPERHLGLTTAQDRPLSPEAVAMLADHIEAGLDLDGLLDGLAEIAPPPGPSTVPRKAVQPGVRVGVARDRAFCFYYPDNLELLTAAGIELVPFSPLTDVRLPEDLDGIYLGGGYPELNAEALAENRTLRAGIREASRRGMPIYGECGGFMYLCRRLETRDGQRYPMCDCFPFVSRMHARLRTLGYRQVQLQADTLLGRKGQWLRGHEFHYSALCDPDAAGRTDTVYAVSSRRETGGRPEGYITNQTLGSYIHLHFGSRPECTQAFGEACRAYGSQRSSNHETP